MSGEVTRVGKSSQSIPAIRINRDSILPEPPLSPLVPEGDNVDAKAYCRFLDYLTQTAPEMLVRSRR